MQVLDGRVKSAEWLAELKSSVQEVAAVLRRPPGLCVVMVGDRADSQVYVHKKEEACRQVCPSTGQVWQTLNIGKSPRVLNHLIVVSGAAHG